MRVAPQPSKPLVTLAVIAFNHESYIKDALDGALGQTYSPLQIILSDDCSDDRSFQLMETAAERYSGPHQLLLNRNTRNLGLAGHLNRVVELARGTVIILAPGDDISEPRRAEAIAAEFGADPDVRAVVSSYSVINGRGEAISDVVLPRDFASFTGLGTIAKKGGWVEMGAAFAYHRDCFTRPGPIPKETLSEDRLLPIRAAVLGKIAFVREKLVRYRTHELSATGRGMFKSRAYEETHQRLLMDDLELMRRAKLLDAKRYANAHAGLSSYPRYLRRLRRLRPGSAVARVYSAAHNYEQTARRILIRIAGLLGRGVDTPNDRSATQQVR